MKQKTNKTSHDYEYLRTPGKRIVIDLIAKELGLNTIPVREAIRQLEADGLIQIEPYSEAIVSTIDETEYVETLSVLAVLKGYATALSSRNMPQEQGECGNLFLREENRQTQQRMDRVRGSIFTLVPKRVLQSVKEHSEIIQLLQKKAPFNEIEEMAHHHKLNTITAFQERNSSDANKTKNKIL